MKEEIMFKVNTKQVSKNLFTLGVIIASAVIIYYLIVSKDIFYPTYMILSYLVFRFFRLRDLSQVEYRLSDIGIEQISRKQSKLVHWEDIFSVQLTKLKILRIKSTGPNPKILLAIFPVSDPLAFKTAVQKFAPPENPIRDFVNNTLL